MTTILNEAQQVAGTDRSRYYGHPLPNHERIARFWQAQLQEKLGPGQHITAEDVAAMMIGLKLARLLQSPAHRDSLVDIAGYARCLEMIADRRAELHQPDIGGTS